MQSSLEPTQAENSVEIVSTESCREPSSSSTHSEEECLVLSHQSERRTKSSKCVDRTCKLLLTESSRLMRKPMCSEYVGNPSKLTAGEPHLSDGREDVSICVSAMLELLISTDEHVVSHSLKIPIPIEIVYETELCIKGLKKSIEREKKNVKPYSNKIWNRKVLKFLRGNIKHAYKTNADLSKET